MKTTDFRTRTELNHFQNNGNIPGVWLIGLDIGYSSVKVFSSNVEDCFPSFAVPVPNDYAPLLIGTKEEQAEALKDCILYKDATGNTWLVGADAQNQLQSGDTSASENILFGRSRYYDPMFKVIAEVGLGLGLWDTSFRQYKGEKICLQTGLPEKYLSDTEELKSVLAGEHTFSLKVGNNDWKVFSFFIEPSEIEVMSQPKGAFYSALINKDNSFLPDAVAISRSNVLVFDPGFGTLDLFPIITGGNVGHGETFNNLGMKRVFQEVAQSLLDKESVELSLTSIQKVLEDGYVSKYDRKAHKSTQIDLAPYVNEACTNVCSEALEKMENAFDLGEYKYLILSGGTSEAWEPFIRELYKDVTSLQIINANRASKDSLIYSNVRGFYISRAVKLAKEMKGRN